MNPGWRGNYLRYKSYFMNMIGRYQEKADIRAYIEILLSLATVSIFAIFALRPTLLTIAGLIKEIDSKKQTLEEMQSKIDNLTSAQILYDKERNRINMLRVSIPDKPYPEVYARQIEGLSEKHNTEILELTAEEAVIIGKDLATINQKTEDLKPLPDGSTQLPVSATYLTTPDRYLSFSNLVSDFENSRRPVKIDIIRMRTVTDDQNIKFLELYIEARLPYFRYEDN